MEKQTSFSKNLFNYFLFHISILNLTDSRQKQKISALNPEINPDENLRNLLRIYKYYGKEQAEISRLKK